MQPWKTSVLCAGKYRPRQFEYHPLKEDVLVFGTLKGEAVVVDVSTNKVCSSICSGLAKDRHDSILGLCWLKRSPTRFVVGSSHGFLRLCDTGPLPSGSCGASEEQGARGGGGGLSAAGWKGDVARGGDGRFGHRTEKRRFARGDSFLSSRSGAVVEAPSSKVTSSSSFDGGGAYHPNGSGDGSEEDIVSARFGRAGKIVTEFETFEKLTSVHVNSTDDHMLASGYTYSVRLFDLNTGTVVRDFSKIHEDHINISRFANHSPFVFATSSFDRTVKAWDSRLGPSMSPIYTCRSELGHVMLSFSPDDAFLLTSAVDNEIKQYLAVDGRLHMNLDVPKTGLDENFTRSYYTSSGRLILSGSSEEQTVRLYCAQTGRLVHLAEMYPGRKHGSLYVQSLRGDPHHDFQFSVLVNYRDTAYPLEIVNVDMLRGNDGEDLGSLMMHASSSRLSTDLRRAYVEKEGADVSLVARDGSRFLAHKLVLACRSPLLLQLLEAAMGSRETNREDSEKLTPVLTTQEGPSVDVMDDVHVEEKDVWPRVEKGRAGGPSWSSFATPSSMVSVCLPSGVAPEVVPVILAFLYTDQLEIFPENSPDGYGATYVDPGNVAWESLLRDVGDGGRGFSRINRQAEGLHGDESPRLESTAEVLMCEKVLRAAKELSLERLYTLVEWHCRELVDNETVVAVTSMALRQKAEQLLRYCVHYLVTHLKMVMELHGVGRIPPMIMSQVTSERERRVYSLSRDPVNDIPVLPTASAVVPTVLVPPQEDPMDPPLKAESSVTATHNGSALGEGSRQSDSTIGSMEGIDVAEASPGNVVRARCMGAGTNVNLVSTGSGRYIARDAGVDYGAASAEGSAMDDGYEDHSMGDDMGDSTGEIHAPRDEIDNEGSDVDLYDAAFRLDSDTDAALGYYELQPVLDGEDELDVENDEDAENDELAQEDNDDNFVDEEVEEEEDHEDTSEDESATSDDEDTGDSSAPECDGGVMTGLLRRRLVPKVTGHTATAVLGSQMVVLGGGNKRQFHGCRHVPVYDPVERTWSKISTRGAAPQALIYHSTTALEPPWTQPRNLLVFGGNSARHNPAPSQAQVVVLDTLRMEWSKPVIGGHPARVRTRHTAVAVYSDEDDFYDAEVSRRGRDFSSSHGSTSATKMMCGQRMCMGLDGGRWEVPGMERSKSSGGVSDCRRDASSPMEFPVQDHGGHTDVVIFGGYSPIESQAYNDVLVISVRRVFEPLSSGSREAGGNKGGNRSCGGDSPPGRCSSIEESDDTDDEYTAGFERTSTASKGRCGGFSSGRMANQGHEGSQSEKDNPSSYHFCRGNQAYRYRWRRPAIRGTPPGTRLAHAAAMVRIAEEDVGGGSGVSRRSYMVVFGGVGTGALYDDTHILRCSNVSTMQWESRFHVRGRPPSRRYGHSMTTLNPSRCLGHAKVAVFGGTSGQVAFNDMFLLTVAWTKEQGVSTLTATWECVSKKMEGPIPCLRSRQTMCQVDGELLIFGGSDEAPTLAAAAYDRNREVDTHVHHVRPRLKKRPLLESSPSILGLMYRHERIMAREVSITLGLVRESEQRRARSAANAMFAASAVAAAAAATSASETATSSACERVGGDESLVSHLPTSRQVGHVKLLSSRVPERGLGVVGRLVPPVTVSPCAQEVAVGSYSRVASRSDRDRAELSRYRFLGPSQRRGRPLWGAPSLEGVMPGMRSHMDETVKKPRPSYGVQLIWECIRPETFVYEAGPEPAVVVKPVTLHKDMQSLVGDTRFSDIRFSFKAVDFNEPTTPTNTAHYAIVPPPFSPRRPATPVSPTSAAETGESYASPRSNSSAARSRRGRCVHSSRWTGESCGENARGVLNRARARASSLWNGVGHGGVDAGKGGVDADDRRGAYLGVRNGRLNERAHGSIDAGHFMAPTGRQSAREKHLANGASWVGDGGNPGGRSGARSGQSDGHQPVLSPPGVRDVIHSAGVRVKERSNANNLSGSLWFRAQSQRQATGSAVRKRTAAESRQGREIPASSGEHGRVVASRGAISPSSEWSLIDFSDAAFSDADDADTEIDSLTTPCSPSLFDIRNRGENTVTGNSGEKRSFFALSEEADSGEAADSATGGIEGRWIGERLSYGVRKEGRGSARMSDDGVTVCESRDVKEAAAVAVATPVDKEGIDAHRMVLSLRSEPMRAMLRSGMRESFAVDALVKDIRPAVFSALLTYLYTDTLQLERPEDIMELLVVANQYTLGDLVALCEGFLQEVLDVDNAVHLYHYADALRMQTFEHRVLTFIIRHWRKITRRDDWRSLPTELAERANEFRRTGTHLFMVGQKDHEAWAEHGKELASWVHNRAFSHCFQAEFVEERQSRLMRDRHGSEDGDADEAWLTAAESESDAASDGSALVEYISPRSQSSAGASDLSLA